MFVFILFCKCIFILHLHCNSRMLQCCNGSKIWGNFLLILSLFSSICHLKLRQDKIDISNLCISRHKAKNNLCTRTIFHTWVRTSEKYDLGSSHNGGRRQVAVHHVGRHHLRPRLPVRCHTRAEIFLCSSNIFVEFSKIIIFFSSLLERDK